MSLPPFQRLLDDHGRDVYRFLIASVGHNAADDCYQETMLSALRAYPKLRSTENLRGWLFTIAHRKALDAHRTRARGPLAVAEPPEPVRGGAAAPGALGVVGEPRDDALWSRVRGLPPKQRAAVVLHHVLDLSYAEVGAALECSEEAARRSGFEGLRRLREEVGVAR